MRFSFLHVADVHLDSPLRGLVSRGDVAKRFVEASRKAFENMVSIAIERRVRFVLIAGDLYDGDWRDWASGHFVVRQFGRLARENILVFMIRGNHDADSVLSKGLPYPRNVVELSVRSVDSIPVDDCEVVIHGRGFATRNVAENYVGTYPQARPGRFNIGMLHTSLTGRDGHGEYAPCSLDDLRSKDYDYWALGHIHRREVVSESPYVLFPGNLQGRHAKESGAKGCSCVTVEDGAIVAVEFLACDVARFDTRDVDLRGVTDQSSFNQRVKDAIDSAAKEAEGLPLALRVRLLGRTAFHRTIAAGLDSIIEAIQAIAYAVSDDLLIEKVEDLSLALEDGRNQAIPQFEEVLREAMNDPGLLGGLAETFADLRSKLPGEVLESMALGSRPLDEFIQDAVASAMRTLDARLSVDVTP